MKGLREKFRKHGGFTLVELLIVVAIIAILIAISIPLVDMALERAKHATDAANERSAKAEAVIEHLNGEGIAVSGYFDAAKGEIVGSDKADDIAGYGKHKGHEGKILKVDITATGTVTLEWGSYGTSWSAINPQNLCTAVADSDH